MPVGRVAYLHLGPMTFTEFLNAVGEEQLVSRIAAFELERGLDTAIHNRLLEHLRTYLFTGGMPEAVLAFARLPPPPGCQRHPQFHHRDLPGGFPQVRRLAEPPAHRGRVPPRGPERGTEGQVHPLLPGRPGGGHQGGHRTALHGARFVESRSQPLGRPAAASGCRPRGCTSSSSWTWA